MSPNVRTATTVPTFQRSLFRSKVHFAKQFLHHHRDLRGGFLHRAKVHTSLQESEKLWKMAIDHRKSGSTHLQNGDFPSLCKRFAEGIP